MSIRAFISIDVEPSEKMMDFHSDLRGANAQVKLVNLEIIHLTLKFLGNTSEDILPEIMGLMDTSVDGMEPFQIEFQGTGAFPNLNRMKVVWIGVKRIGEMRSIAEYLDDGLSNMGFKKEKRKFSPHLTVGRVKGGRNKHLLAEIISRWKDEDFGTMDVNNIRLKKSILGPQGPTYSTLHESRIGKG